MLKQNVNSPIYLAILFVLATLLSLLAVPAEAAHLDLHWTNATTRADGTAFNADTELKSIDIGCGDSLTGPFNVFTSSVLNETGQSAPTSFTTETAPDTLKGCVAFSVDTDGIVSAPSNVGAVSFKSPIEAIQDLQSACFGTCPGTVNFNFTITTQ